MLRTILPVNLQETMNGLSGAAPEDQKDRKKPVEGYVSQFSKPLPSNKIAVGT
jgi:hypothetical protein